jgi:predicted dehydrogenase
MAYASTVLRPVSVSPALELLCARDVRSAAAFRRRFGWRRLTEDWRDLAIDSRVDLFDNSAPNSLHYEPTVSALMAGKHVLCEKPLGISADEAFLLWAHAAESQRVHMVGFNLRFVPAIRLAREMLEAGVLDEVVHFRGRFLASSSLSSDAKLGWRSRRADAGHGVLADLGSHLIDLARYLVGEPSAVTATTKTFVASLDGVAIDVEDAAEVILEFPNGAVGQISASRVAGRHEERMVVEVDGRRGSLAFDLGRLNELSVTRSRKREETIEVTAPSHPFMGGWWPTPGHSIGWGDTFTHQILHLLDAISAITTVRPHGADFEDGYRAAEVCDAAVEAADTGRRRAIVYRSLGSSAAPSP